MPVGGRQTVRDPLTVKSLPEPLAAQRGPQHDPEAIGVVHAAVEQTGRDKRLLRGSARDVDAAVQPRFPGPRLRGHETVVLKLDAQLAGHLDLSIGRHDRGFADPGTAGEDVGPALLDVAADGGEQADPGDNDVLG